MAPRCRGVEFSKVTFFGSKILKSVGNCFGGVGKVFGGPEMGFGGAWKVFGACLSRGGINLFLEIDFFFFLKIIFLNLYSNKKLSILSLQGIKNNPKCL